MAAAETELLVLVLNAGIGFDVLYLSLSLYVFCLFALSCSLTDSHTHVIFCRRSLYLPHLSSLDHFFDDHLSLGMGPEECVATLEGLKDSSKKISSHKSRELYWAVSLAT